MSCSGLTPITHKWFDNACDKTSPTGGSPSTRISSPAGLETEPTTEDAVFLLDYEGLQWFLIDL